MSKISLLYSKNQIRKAGDVLAGRDFTMSIEDAYEIMNNWRAFHNHPLNTMQMNLRQISQRYSKNFLVAQRLKRSESIINKLRILPKMPLSNMQDIAGCRVVVSTMKEVNSIVEHFHSRSRMQHERVKTTNYIEQPKPSGYRSVHVIYKYKSNNKRTEQYNGIPVEMQIRTTIQHSWATAVETAGMFLESALKSNQGPDNWKRFFRLAGSLFAYLENNPIDQELGNITKIRYELKALDRELSAIHKLGLYNQSIQITDTKKRKNDKYYVLELNSEDRKLTIWPFARDEFDKASEVYVAKEMGHGSKDVVLVSIDSITKLRKAYPNYFNDTTKFITNYNKAISKQRKKV